MEIRPYNSSDADTILSWCGDEKAFYRWTAGVMGEYPITSKEFSFVEAMDAFTAVEDDKPIGFFTLRRPDESVNVLRIGFVIVDPALRGKGLGKQMMKLGLDHAVNDMKADAVEDDYVGGVIQKMNVHVLRLAIMAHLLTDQWRSTLITGDTMRYALRLADYFTRIHIKRIYPLLRNTVSGQRPVTNAELIQTIFRQFKVKSQNALAEVLGVSQQYINKVMKIQ